jgi:hypothetical protein
LSNKFVFDILKLQIGLFRFIVAVPIAGIMIGCGFHMNFKSSTAAIGDKQQNPNFYKLDFPGITLHVRPYNDIRTFQLTYFVILPLYFDTKEVPSYSPKPFTILFAFLPYESGFSFNPNDITLHLDGKILKPLSISAQLVPDPSPGSDYYKSWVARGHVMCGFNQSKEYHPIPIEADYLFDKSGMWYCYEIQFDVSAPDPSTEFSIFLNGLFRNGEPYKIPPIPFQERHWSRTDSAP